MLAGPELIAIRPDAGALLQDGDTLGVAPREFNLLFKGGANLNAATINANTVRLVRSGGDGQFGDGNDVIVALGYVGLASPGSTDPSDLQRIVIRPASSASFNATSPAHSFPDDLYQIQVIGAGANHLANLSGEAFNHGSDLITNFRLDRGAQVVAVMPQPVSRNTQRISLTSGGVGGTYVLSFAGQETAPISISASNQQIQSAIEALPKVQPGDVVVSGAREVTFQGQFAGEQVPLMSVNSSAMTGGTAMVTRLTSLTQASNQIVIYFDNQVLDAAEVVDPKFYRLIDTRASLIASDDQTSLPQHVTYDPVDNSVVLTFASAIAEGTYRLDVGQSGGDNSTLSTAFRVGSLFNENRFEFNGFLGDIGGRSDNELDVDLYQVNLTAGSTLSVRVTPHLATLAVRLRLLDASGAELNSVTSAAGADGLLTIPVSSTAAHHIEVTSANAAAGSYFVTASVAGNSVSTSDNNSSVGTATELGTLGAAGITLTRAIQPQSIPLPPYPGGQDEPGHRQIQREAHIGAAGTTPTVPAATRVVRYYFPLTLGTDTSGNSYLNLITAAEKQIVREIFEIYAQKSGFEFIESPATIPGGADLMIGKGDFRAVSPTLGPNDGVAGLASGSFAILNGSIYNQANRFFGDGFTSVMFHEIGHSLGMGHSYELPSNMGAGVPNDVLPGDHDIVHLQRIVPPNSTDIDLYRFALTESGRLTAETIAERLPTPSLLNSVLTLYRQTSTGDIEWVARNDQYYGSDSFLDLELEPGVYFVGVTSTGNTNYDPRVPDSGFGGTTNGVYQLKLDFKASRGGALRDVSGTEIDGNGDGSPGGVYSFWFQASDPASTLFVDKLNDVTAGAVDGTGSLSNPYDTLDFALHRAGDRIVVPTDGPSTITVGEQFVINDGINTVTFRFGTTGLDPIDLAGTTTAAEVALRIRDAITLSRTAGRLAPSVDATVVGRIVQLSGIDHLDLAASPTLLHTPNLVRIVGNGGADHDLQSLSDNRPYLVGLDTNGNPLADGAEFLVPQGVTAMIQAGALFKMRKANLDAGTSSANISRSQSAIQVLGTPRHAVFFSIVS